MTETQYLVIKNTITCLLQQCKNMRELKKIHTLIITSPLLSKNDHYFLISRLLFFCAISASGSLSYAANVFQTIQNPNLFMYNAMIRAYASKTMNGFDGINPYRDERFDDVKRTRTIMLERGIKKELPGSSMIEVDGVVHEFSVRGSSEVVIQELECILYILMLVKLRMKIQCHPVLQATIILPASAPAMEIYGGPPRIFPTMNEHHQQPHAVREGRRTFQVKEEKRDLEQSQGKRITGPGWTGWM
ncbi:hypothetical protein ACET3Z_014871 [Daucus carota]